MVIDDGMLHAIEKKTEFGRGLLQQSWIAYEFQTLQALHDAGADVPEPQPRQTGGRGGAQRFADALDADEVVAVVMADDGPAAFGAQVKRQVNIRGEIDNTVALDFLRAAALANFLILAMYARFSFTAASISPRRMISP